MASSASFDKPCKLRVVSRPCNWCVPLKWKHWRQLNKVSQTHQRFSNRLIRHIQAATSENISVTPCRSLPWRWAPRLWRRVTSWAGRAQPGPGKANSINHVCGCSTWLRLQLIVFLYGVKMNDFSQCLDSTLHFSQINTTLKCQTLCPATETSPLKLLKKLVVRILRGVYLVTQVATHQCVYATKNLYV